MAIKVLRSVLCAAGTLLFLDGVVFLLISNLTLGTFLALGLGAVLFVYGLFFGKIHVLSGRGIFRVIRYLVYTGLACILAMVLFLAAYGGRDTQNYQEDAVIVLGAGLHGREVSSPLAFRLQTAAQYHAKNPDAVIVVTGGRGFQEEITEASAMQEYLVGRGVPEEKILKEERATSTYENFCYSKELLDTQFERPYSVVLITNRFHVWRAEQIADNAGIDAAHLGADTLWFSKPINYLRECAAVIKFWIFQK